MRGRLFALLFAAALAAGCGKSGPPVAPETRLPQPVTDLQAVVEDGTVVLTWTTPARRADNTELRDPRQARVYRTEDDGEGEPRAALLRRGRIAGWHELSPLSLTPGATGKRAPREQHLRVVDGDGLTMGRRYTYVVLTEDEQGRVSLPSRRVSVVVVPPPEAPRNLSATAGEGEVRLAWEAPLRLADGTPLSGTVTYEVFRAPDPTTPGVSVTPKPLETTTFADRSVENDRTYQYSVRALRQDGDTVARGAATTPVAATPRDMTPPAPPADLIAVAAADTVRLSWRPSPDADVASYAVYRAGPGQAFARVGVTPAVRTVYVDTDVAPGTYRYAVTALDRGAQPNESARSNVVTVTFPPRRP